LIIKELTSTDLPRYRMHILDFLIDTYCSNFSISRELAEKISQEKIEALEKYIHDGSATVLTAIYDDELAGFIWLYKHVYFGEPRLHINQIAVNPKHRGKGIGTLLIREAENCARSFRINTIDLNVSECNPIAINLYLKLGFATERRYMTKQIAGDIDGE
jgi:Acetyltransferases